MKKTSKTYGNNKGKKSFTNKSLLRMFSTSISRVVLAVAPKKLFFGAQKFIISLAIIFVLALIVNAGDIRMGGGKLNLDGGLSVDTSGNLEVIGKIHAVNDICTDANGGKCLSTVSGGSGSDTDWTVSGNTMYSGVSGNIGVGTTDPKAKLHVENGDIIIQTPSASAATLFFREGTTNMMGLYYEGGASGNPLHIRQTQVGRNLVTFKENGYVGIGTSSPSKELDVSGQIYAAGDICTGANGGKCLSTLSGGVGSDSDWTVSGNTMYSEVSGNIGVGTTGPRAKLHVDGSVALGGFGTSTVGDLTIYDTGNNHWRTYGVGANSFLTDMGGTSGVGTWEIRDFNVRMNGKLTATGGVDPPYVSFSAESYESIREYAEDVEDHEEVMVFWNAKNHRMEVYDITEDKFYTITGEGIE